MESGPNAGTSPEPERRGARWDASLDAGPGSVARYRARSTANLLRMGHCAPTVAQTLLELAASDADWLVRLAGGLPGVANTGHECGALTAPLLLLGLRHGGALDRGLPVVIERGHAYCDRFLDCNGALACAVLRDPLLRRCARAVRRAPEQLARALAADPADALPPQVREAYRLLWAHLAAHRFHCAHAVLREVVPAAPPELLDATVAFVGGTVMKGMTCSALVAGVMAIALETGGIERSRLRVLRMLGRMVTGRNVLEERLNAFNGALNRGNDLARWFAAEHGTTQCRVLVGCTFSSLSCVERFIRGRQVSRCEQLAAAVAERARATIRAGGVEALPTLH